MEPQGFDPFEIIRKALNSEYASLLPEGYQVYKIAEYDPGKHTAPNLWFEKRQNPEARYLVILMDHKSSVPALGVTVNDALKAAIQKIEKRNGAGN